MEDRRRGEEEPAGRPSFHSPMVSALSSVHARAGSMDATPPAESSQRHAWNGCGGGDHRQVRWNSRRLSEVDARVVFHPSFQLEQEGMIFLANQWFGGGVELRRCGVHHRMDFWWLTCSALKMMWTVLNLHDRKPCTGFPLIPDHT